MRAAVAMPLSAEKSPEGMPFRAGAKFSTCHLLEMGSVWAWFVLAAHAAATVEALMVKSSSVGLPVPR